MGESGGDEAMTGDLRLVVGDVAGRIGPCGVMCPGCREEGRAGVGASNRLLLSISRPWASAIEFA